MPKLTRNAYAKHRGCDVKAVHAAVKSGRIKMDENNRIDVDEADRDWNANTRPVVGRNSGTPGESGSYANLRVAKAMYDAKQAKLDYEKSAGKVVDTDAVKERWTSIGVAVRSAIEGIPDALAPQVLAATTIREAYDIIAAEVHKVLHQLAGDIEGLA